MKNQHLVHLQSEIEGGYFLMARKVAYSSLNASRPEDFKLAVNLIALANWKDGRWYDQWKKSEIVIRRGQYLTSIRKLAEITRMSPKTIRTSLKRLERAQFLAQVPAQGYTLLTICNYARYQSYSSYEGTETGTETGKCRANAGQMPGKCRATIETGEYKKAGEAGNILSSLSALWNELTSSHLPAVKAEPSGRCRKIEARMKEHPDLVWWRQVIEKVVRSPFLLGNNNSGWKASFDWLVKNGENAVKVFEGNYDGNRDNRKANHATASGTHPEGQGPVGCSGKFDNLPVTVIRH